MDTFAMLATYNQWPLSFRLIQHSSYLMWAAI